MTPHLFSPAAAAEYYGVSVSTFNAKIAKRLPRLFCGRRVLYAREAMDLDIERFQPGQDISIDKQTEVR